MPQSAFMKGHQPRVIAGEWRGRRLTVPPLEGLRPTPDRVRETVFNWLAADCRGSSVLDCCAGSGAMVMEALSRGASHAVAIEKQKAAARNLQQQANDFRTDKLTVIHGNAINCIPGLEGTFDLVFIDPPYADPALRLQCLELLELGRKLNPQAKIYFEWPATEKFELPTDRLTWWRRKKAGQVEFGVAEWQATG